MRDGARGVHRDVPRAGGARLRARVRDERVVAVHARVRPAARPRHQHPRVPRGGDRPRPARPADRVPPDDLRARSRAARCWSRSSRCAPASRRRACRCWSQSQRMERFHLLDDFWVTWQQWFAELEETHTSLGVLSFFRSPLGAPLVGHRRAARCSTPRRCGSPPSTCRSTPRPGSACAAAFFALRAIADYFGIPFDPDPHPRRPDQHQQGRVPRGVRPSWSRPGSRCATTATQAWRDFTGWRVNYDVRCSSASPGFVMAPYAPWSSDRSLALPAPDAAAPDRTAARARASSTDRLVEEPGLGRRPASRRGG